jgi:serine/threonine-protein kinase
MWEGAKLFLESAERACWLEHHSILDIFDWGEAGGVPYVVTGAQGRTLVDLVGAGGPLGEAEAVHLAATVADGLAYLHEQGVVYQTVDVGSTVITADARSAQLSWPIFCVPTGTPATREDGSIQRAFAVPYAAPEVLLGTCDTIEPAVDLYCLGELIYFLLTGRTPYQPQNIYDLGQMKRQPPPDLREFAPEVTAPTVALVNALLRFEPAQRPAGAALVRDQLGRLARRLRGLSKASATSSDATILDRPESLFNYPSTG